MWCTIGNHCMNTTVHSDYKQTLSRELLVDKTRGNHCMNTTVHSDYKQTLSRELLVDKTRGNHSMNTTVHSDYKQTLSRSLYHLVDGLNLNAFFCCKNDNTTTTTEATPRPHMKRLLNRRKKKTSQWNCIPRPDWEAQKNEIDRWLWRILVDDSTETFSQVLKFV